MYSCMLCVVLWVFSVNVIFFVHLSIKKEKKKNDIPSWLACQLGFADLDFYK